jgi:hypothetical protein
MSPLAPRIVVTESFDWSDTRRGKYVEFEPNDQISLEIVRQLGRVFTSDVHETICRGLAVAIKQRHPAPEVAANLPSTRLIYSLF